VVGGWGLDEKDAHRSGRGLCLCWLPQSRPDPFFYFFLNQPVNPFEF